MSRGSAGSLRSGRHASVPQLTVGTGGDTAARRASQAMVGMGTTTRNVLAELVSRLTFADDEEMEARLPCCKRSLGILLCPILPSSLCDRYSDTASSSSF